MGFVEALCPILAAARRNAEEDSLIDADFSAGWMPYAKEDSLIDSGSSEGWR